MIFEAVSDTPQLRCFTPNKSKACAYFTKSMSCQQNHTILLQPCHQKTTCRPLRIRNNHCYQLVEAHLLLYSKGKKLQLQITIDEATDSLLGPSRQFDKQQP